MDDDLTRAEKMNVDHLSPEDPWRAIVESPKFMAFPAKDPAEPGATFHDAYVHKLFAKRHEGNWVPHAEVDAFLKAAVFRMAVILESDQDGDLLILGETSEQEVTEKAEDLVEWTVSEQKRGGTFATMSDQDAERFYYQLHDRLRTRCAIKSSDPAIATADEKVLGPGIEMIIDHTAAAALNNPAATPFAAAYTTFLICGAWGKSPFRQRIVDIATA